VDDSLARRDWGFAPQYDFQTAFRDYLIPTIKQRYTKGTKGITKGTKEMTKDAKGSTKARSVAKDAKER
jgi:hypothetical protein